MKSTVMPNERLEHLFLAPDTPYGSFPFEE